MSKKSKSHSVKVKLKHPIDWASDTGENLVDEVELKRPKGKHIKHLDGEVSMSDLLKIASKVSGYTPAFFDELDAEDCLEIVGVIGDFLGSGPEIGKTALP